MARYSKPRKNSKRIDPRYFLDETTDRDNLGEQKKPKTDAEKEAARKQAIEDAKKPRKDKEQKITHAQRKAAEARSKSKNEALDKDEEEIKKITGELEKASGMHQGQADRLAKMVNEYGDMDSDADLDEALNEQEEEEEAPVPVQSDTLTPEDTSRLAEDDKKTKTKLEKRLAKNSANIKKAGGWDAARRNQGEVSNAANWGRARKNQGTVQWANPSVKESKLAEDREWPNTGRHPWFDSDADYSDVQARAIEKRMTAEDELQTGHEADELKARLHGISRIPGYRPGRASYADSLIGTSPSWEEAIAADAMQESFSYKLEEAMQRSVLAIASDVADIVGNKDPQTVMNIFDMVYSTLFPGQGAPAGDMPPGSGEGEEGHGEPASAKRIGFTIAEDTFPALETIVAEELAFMRETLMSDDIPPANDLETFESIQPLEEQ